MISEAYRIIPHALRHFRSLLVASGWDHEDAVQELVLVLVARLQGAHPYDATRSRFTSYCYLLTRSVLANRATKKNRRARGDALLALHHKGRTAEMDVEALFPEP